MADLSSSPGPSTGNYPDWQSAALGGNLLSYAWDHRPTMGELVPGWNPNESGAQKLLDYGSLPARVAFNALSAPLVSGGRALQGFLDSPPMAEPESARRDATGAVLGLAGTRLAGGSGPSGSLGVFAGAKAGGAPLEALESAKNLTNAGVTPENIWKQTGWFQGPDGQWKFEIPDSSAKFTPDAITQNPYSKTELMGLSWLKTQKLGEVLDHPELFKAYPELADVPVRSTGPLAGLSGLQGAVYSDGSIGLTSGKQSDLLSTLLHEVQHKIQGTEGFATGGMSADFLPKDFTVLENSISARQKTYFDQLNNAGINYYSLQSALDRKAVGEKLYSNHETALNDAKDLGLTDNDFSQIRVLGALSREIGEQKKTAFGKYQNLAGEVESRNVQERQAQGDYKSPPWQTEGYPAGPQIVKFRGQDMKLEPVDHDPFQQEPTK